MDMNMLKTLVEQEGDGKETVTFNYPKYEAVGTPHKVWFFNVSKVEESLEDIIEGAPWREEYPLIHLRREETDEDGRVIRVHFDIFGKPSMIKISRMMLSKAEEVYVMANRLATEEGRETVRKVLDEVMPPELRNLMKEAGVNLGDAHILPVTGNPNDPNEAIDQILENLKSHGINVDADQVKILNGPMKNVPDDSLTKIEDGSDYDGPLDLSPADKVASKSPTPFFVMPNPNPDEVN